MKCVNWGIIGTGDVTEVKSGPGLYKADHSNLIGVYNRTHHKAVDFAKRHGVAKVYEEVGDLIGDPDIDVVYIATPPVDHKSYAIDVLKAGKIPYIEKPLTMTYEEALAIKDLSDRLKIPVYVAFYRRGLAKFLAIKELLAAQEIGQVKFVHVIQTSPLKEEFLDREHLPWRVKPEISGGGLFLDIGSHVLDCLMMYFGPLESIHGYALNSGGYYEAEDTVMATFKFKNGLTGTGNWCFVADRQVNRVEIIGDKGRIIYDGLSAKSFKVIKNGAERMYEFRQPDHIAMPYEQAIVDELIGLRKSHANFDHAVNLTQMTDRILKTYDASR